MARGQGPRPCAGSPRLRALHRVVAPSTTPPQLMPNDPLRDSSRYTSEEADSHAPERNRSAKLEPPMQQRRRDVSSRAAKAAGGLKLFVLDANVLMHDPTSLFRFEEHDVFLPMVTLEELDDNKKGMSEVARNARQASRFLDEIVSQEGAIEKGYSLKAKSGGGATGLPFPQTHSVQVENPHSVAPPKAHNVILPVALHPNEPVPD